MGKTWSYAKGGPTDPPKKIPASGYRRPDGLWEMPNGETYANPEPFVLKEERYTAGSYPAVDGKIPMGRKYIVYNDPTKQDGWEEFADGGPVKPPKKNEPVTAPVPTRADSLFLLNNNAIINKMLSSGRYKWNSRGDIPAGSNGMVKYDIERLDELIKSDISVGQKTKPKEMYKDVRGVMVGTQDWAKGGGEDAHLPKHYLHPNIVPQFLGDLVPKNTRDPFVFSYGYDDLAITPWDMLSETQRKERIAKYGTYGTPSSPVVKPVQPVIYQKPKPKPAVVSIPAATTTPTTTPVTKPIIVTDPNDPRLKAYRDSITLFNKSKETQDWFYKQVPNGMSVYSGTEWNNYLDEFKEDTKSYNKYVKAYDRLTSLNKKAPSGPLTKFQISSIYNGEDFYKDTDETFFTNFKKPVQPVVYQKPIRPFYSSIPTKQPSIEPLQLQDQQLQPTDVPPAITFPKAINTYSAAGYPMVGGKTVPSGRIHDGKTWSILE